MLKEFAKGGYPQTSGIWIHGDNEPYLVGKFGEKPVAIAVTDDDIPCEAIREACEEIAKSIMESVNIGGF